LTILYSNKSVLIVDDFKSFLDSLKNMVKELEVTNIDLVSNANDFLKHCENKSYDIILMDYNLGEGKNGQQLLEELHNNKLLKHTTVVIMITAEVSQEMVLSAIELQPDAYLAKPFTFKLLKSRLDNAVKRNDVLYKLLTALDDENYTRAIDLCEPHISKATRYAKWCIQTKLNLLYKLGRYDEALIIYQELLSERQPDWALLGIGKIYAMQEKYLEALTIFKTLLSNNPMFLEVYDWLSKMYIALGETDTAQKTLERAVFISPRSYNRLHDLAQICEQNNDFENAVNVYRRTQNLAENSIHYSPDNGLELAKSLTTFAEHSDEKQARKLTDEALVTLNKVETKFKHTKNIAIKTKLVEARVYHALKDEQKTQSTLEAAKELTDSMTLSPDPELLMEFASAYTNTGNNKKAQKILNTLGKKHAGDEQLLCKIEKLSEHTFSEIGKQEVNKLTTNGIQFYDEGDFDSSIMEFARATRRYPKHIGLQLNLIQALLGALANDPANIKYLERCQTGLNQVKNSSSLKKSKERYLELLEKFNKIDSRRR